MHISANQKIDEIAARWFLRMRESDIAPSEQLTFEQWLTANPAHQQAYAELASTWAQTDSSENLQNMVTAIKQKNSLENSNRQKKLNQQLINAALGCVLGISALFGFKQYQVWQAAPVMQMAASNPVGQITSQTLEDGSKITLSANSALQVTYYRHQRLIKLERGEAIFEVSKDESRPFIVNTDHAKITVLGTRFAVNKLSYLTRVSVDHGRVKIESQQPQASLTLTNGQVAEVATLRAPQQVKLNAANAFGFAQGKLSFDRANFVEIAETLSRYRAIPLEVQGNVKAEITAIVQTKDAEQFIQGLPNIANVQVLQNQHHTLIVQH